MMAQFKLNVEWCSEFSGSKSKEDPTGAAAAIRTRTTILIIEPTTLNKDLSKVNVVLWKDLRRQASYRCRLDPWFVPLSGATDP